MILDSFRLDGQVAVVTGARRGLGQGAALALAEAGADVVLVNRGDGSETAAQIEALGRRVHSIEIDFATADHDDYVSVIDEGVDALGRIDILVNNAGTIKRVPAVDHPTEDWEEVLAVNLDSVFHLSQAAGRRMIDQARAGSSTSHPCSRSREASSSPDIPPPSTPSPGSPRRSRTNGRRRV